MHYMQEMHPLQQLPEARGPALLTTKEVQALVNVDRSTIYRMAEDGRIPAVKVGRQWRFPADRIHAWLEAGRRPADRERATAGTNGLTLPEGSLQTLAELIGSVFGVMVIVTDMEGRPLIDVANPCGMFRAAASTPATLERCIEGWREFGSDPDLVPHLSPSHLGFLCARAFVRDGSELTAMVIAGGIAPDDWPPPRAEVERIAADIDLPADTLAEHIDEIYHLDEAGRRRLLDLLPRFGVLISQISHDTARTRRRLDSIAALAGRDPQRRET
jgi:excisionase family DNA binding protein